MPRLRILSPVMAIALLLPATLTSARDTCSVGDDPEFDGKTAKLTCSDGQTFQQYLEASSCGGADRDISVVGYEGDEKKDKNKPQLGKESFIAKVNGAPGREGVPLGDVLSGMAKRVEGTGMHSDGFQFPDDTQGATTTCYPGTSKTRKPIFQQTGVVPEDPAIDPALWGFPTGYRMGDPGTDTERKEFGYPYFEDPPCRWRLKEGKTKKDPPPYERDDFEEIKEKDAQGNDEKGPPGQTPPFCEGLCQELNEWQYWDCIVSVQNPVSGGPMDKWVCLRDGYRYLCNDQENLGGDACAIGKENFGLFDWPNASGCIGENCRCSGLRRDQGCERTPEPPDYDKGVGDPEMPYRSYFRGYVAGFVRKALKQYVEDDKAEEGEIPIACYGFYVEFDPKKYRTHAEDRRCVIRIDVTERKDTQKGRAGIATPIPDVPPLPPKEFDKKRGVWWQMVAGGFSHLNPLHNNLSLALSAIDSATTRGSTQLENVTPENRGFAPGGMLLDFDDTGPLRTLVRWWHKQETAMSTVLSPPTLRLVHPPAWAMGLSPNDPLFQGAQSSSAGGGAASAWAGPRDKPIDDQIRGREDVVGDILYYIERTLLSVQEAPLPVLVPLGSAPEYRARAQALCAWYIQKNPDAKDCTEGRTGEVIARLEDYADRVEQVRSLRLQLAKIAGKLLKSQKGTLTPLHKWSKKNLRAYEKYLKQRDKVLALQGEWQAVQDEFKKFHEKMNAPWCMNSRYTTAIYSLLDPWMTTRSDAGSAFEHVRPEEDGAGGPWEPGDGEPPEDGDPGDGAGESIHYSIVGGRPEDDPPPRDLPSVEALGIVAFPDRVLDLSVFKKIHAPFELPVLKPTQVTLNLEDYLPPASGDEDDLKMPPELPSFDPILKIVKDTEKALPSICGPKIDTSGNQAQDAPPGEIRKDKDGNYWQKQDDGGWKSFNDPKNDMPSDPGYKNTKWSDNMIDENAPEVVQNVPSSAASNGSSSSEDDAPCEKGEEPPDVEAPDLMDDATIAEISATLTDIKTMLDGMNQAYDEFWQSLVLDKEDEELRKEQEKLKCRDWDTSLCENVEMDLIERLTRIATRPGVLLKEDFDSYGQLRTAPQVCMSDDNACQMLNPEYVMPKAGWQTKIGSSSSSSSSQGANSAGSNGSQGSASSESIENLRKRLRDATLPAPLGEVDPDTFPPYSVDLEDLLPSFSVPQDIDLKPGSSSSAPASQP